MDEDYPRDLVELEKRFTSAAACRAYLAALRWPGGFCCPRCGATRAWAMGNGRWLCGQCRRQTSVTAGTIFQDSRLPLPLWFRAMWYVTSQKNGVSALGVKHVLGLGSYQTAWAWLHKLRRAMVRPDRDRLSGRVEVDETYWGAAEPGVIGRQTHTKVRIMVAAEVVGQGIGRIRLACVPTLAKIHVHGFIRASVKPGQTIVTDGFNIYDGLVGYQHEPIVISSGAATACTLLPRVHRVVSLLKRWLLGTHQGAVRPHQLGYYLDEFTFRFNRRTSASRGKLFYRLVQQAVQVGPRPYRTLIDPKM